MDLDAIDAARRELHRSLLNLLLTVDSLVDLLERTRKLVDSIGWRVTEDGCWKSTLSFVNEAQQKATDDRWKHQFLELDAAFREFWTAHRETAQHRKAFLKSLPSSPADIAACLLRLDISFRLDDESVDTWQSEFLTLWQDFEDFDYSQSLTRPKHVLERQRKHRLEQLVRRLQERPCWPEWQNGHREYFSQAIRSVAKMHDTASELTDDAADRGTSEGAGGRDRRPQSEGYQLSEILIGWAAITTFLNVDHDRSWHGKIRRLNRIEDGPLVFRPRKQPRVEKSALLEWWASLAEKQQELADRERERDREIELNVGEKSQHSYGKSGKAIPEIAGSVQHRKNGRVTKSRKK